MFSEATLFEYHVSTILLQIIGIGYTVTTDCLMVHRIVRLNLNWKKIIVQSL